MTLLNACLLGAGVFGAGVFGAVSNSRSVLFLLVYLELALLGIVLCLSLAGAACADPYGQLYALLVLVGAAAESAVGLALVFLWHRASGGVSLPDSRILRG